MVIEDIYRGLYGLQIISTWLTVTTIIIVNHVDQFQFQRKAMPKTSQTNTQLHSSHTPVKQCSKFSKPGFSSTWTMNFQMFKLNLEKAERNQRSNCQHPLDRGKRKTIPKNIYFCFIDYAKAFDCVDHNKLWKILKEMGISDHLTCLLRNLYAP